MFQGYSESKFRILRYYTNSLKMNVFFHVSVGGGGEGGGSEFVCGVTRFTLNCERSERTQKEQVRHRRGKQFF